MLRQSTRMAKRAAVASTKLVAGTSALGVAGVAAYTQTEQGRGLKRELQFWRGMAPIVVDYYWQLAESSPYVKYHKYLANKQGSSEENDSTQQQEQQQQEQKQARRQRMQALHQQHAPEILEILLQLKGLYIKLGQVLSVTTLPVPEAYREKFRTLQSDVPGWETFDEVVKPVLEKELGQSLDEIFSSIDPVPCGAASIGQAHKATLAESQEDVIIKVQYPDAAWQIPADIQCVSDLLKVCVFFGVVDEDAANLSFGEFQRQFLAELDYTQERQNLMDIYNSSQEPDSPYQKWGVVVPHVYPELCSSKVITMSYLPGPKLEEEARRQLEALGIDTRKGIQSWIRQNATAKRDEDSLLNGDSKATVATEDIISTDDNNVNNKNETAMMPASSLSWKQSAAIRILQVAKSVVSVDAVLASVRFARQLHLWSTAATVYTLQLWQSLPLLGNFLPSTIQNWVEDHSTAKQQAQMLGLTQSWIDALLEVHAHQIFDLGCFNADAHPGNILVVNNTQLGLIDFGQCKRLSPKEQADIGRLIVTVADKSSSDLDTANAFRALGVQTRNDSTEFLAKVAKFMFGSLQTYHLDHKWHRELQQTDKITYFPNQLSMVYRTSMLLRGLAASLQFNVSVGELWEPYARQAMEKYGSTSPEMIDNQASEFHLGPQDTATQHLIRRMSTIQEIAVKNT